MIPVNIRLFDIESASEADVERIKLDREINRYTNSFNKGKYIHLLCNNEILKLRISMFVEKFFSYLYELKKTVKGKEDLTEIVSIDKIYDYNFPIQIERVGKYRLKGNFRKTENVVIPNPNKQYNNLFYYLCELYDEEIKKCKDRVSFIDTDLILLKYQYTKKDIIDRIINDLNIEILSSYSYSEIEELLSKLKYFSRIENINIESNKLTEIVVEAVNNRELFEDLGIKIGKEKQKIKN